MVRTNHDTVTIYTIDREYRTTDADEAEPFARRGAHVTARTTKRPER